MARKDWNRIGLAAALVLVPGGFLLGAVLAARRLRAGAGAGKRGKDLAPEEAIAASDARNLEPI